MIKDPLILQHLKGKPIGRFPVWMMRQAGRYLSSYKRIRKEVSFWQSVTTPEIAARISLLPLEELNLDAVIFFSDILTLPYSLGLPISMVEKVGPVIQPPLRKRDDFEVFRQFIPEEHTPFVENTLKTLREKTDRTLIGFCGAPWTVATYLVEGQGKHHFSNLLEWLYRDPASLASALDPLFEASQKLALYQIRSGANLFQLFDTWVSEMPMDFFDKYYAPKLQEFFLSVKKLAPVIYFPRRAHHLLPAIRSLSFDVLSADSLLSLSEVEKRTQGQFSLQGNLDPVLLLTSEDRVRFETRKLVAEARGLSRPAILNLGHGILPDTPLAHVKAFVEEASTLWI